MEKRLYLSDTNKVLGGVCGGLGEYLGIDPVIVRLLLVFAVIFHGFGVLLYLIAWIVIPRRPLELVKAEHQAKATATVESPAERSFWRTNWVGILLITLGVLLLTDEYWYYFDWSLVWPLALIACGGILLLTRTNRSRREEINGSQASVNGANQSHGGGLV